MEKVRKDVQEEHKRTLENESITVAPIFNLKKLINRDRVRTGVRGYLSAEIANKDGSDLLNALKEDNYIRSQVSPAEDLILHFFEFTEGPNSCFPFGILIEDLKHNRIIKTFTFISLFHSNGYWDEHFDYDQEKRVLRIKASLYLGEIYVDLENSKACYYQDTNGKNITVGSEYEHFSFNGKRQYIGAPWISLDYFEDFLNQYREFERDQERVRKSIEITLE